jgi:adenylate cyclase
MPFENMSHDPDQEFFADGLTEDLITALSQWRSFPVIARNSTFAYKGQSPDIRKVGEELGARYVIEGSVRKAGSRLRVTAQLINTDTGHHVWAERYDRDVEDFFDLQDEITQQISAVIAPELDRAEHKRSFKKHSENLDAWECYQRGLSQWHKFRRDELAEARNLFERAIELDPEFGAAYVGYACTSFSNTRVGFSTGDRDKALSAARRAIELDNEDASAHWALGLVYYADKNLKAAASEFEHVIKLNPNFAVAHGLLGSSLSGSGRCEEAIPFLEHSVRLNPRDPLIGLTYSRMSRAYLFLRKHAEAVNWAREGLKHQNIQWPLTCNLASALAHLGRFDEARDALEDTETFRPGITTSFVREHTTVSDPDCMDHLIDGLIKAGMPE